MKYGTDEEKAQIKDKIQLGVFQDLQKPGFFDLYDDLMNRLKEKDAKAKEGKK